MIIDEKEYLHLIPKCLKTHFGKVSDFEDLTSEAFFGLRNAIEKYDPKRTSIDNLERYLYQGIRWHIGSFLHARHGILKRQGHKNNKQVSLSEEKELFSNIPIRYITVDDWDNIDEKIDLDRILDRTNLTEKEGAVIDGMLANMTKKEISTAKGVSRQAIDSCYKRAIKRIKKTISVDLILQK
jgi:RNA polymerase sigma factor (sigma-70 family)